MASPMWHVVLKNGGFFMSQRQLHCIERGGDICMVLLGKKFKKIPCNVLFLCFKDIIKNLKIKKISLNGYFFCFYIILMR
jgi:hypothetical protein